MKKSTEDSQEAFEEYMSLTDNMKAGEIRDFTARCRKVLSESQDAGQAVKDITQCVSKIFSALEPSEVENVTAILESHPVNMKLLKGATRKEMYALLLIGTLMQEGAAKESPDDTQPPETEEKKIARERKEWVETQCQDIRQRISGLPQLKKEVLQTLIAEQDIVIDERTKVESYARRVKSIFDKLDVKTRFCMGVGHELAFLEGVNIDFGSKLINVICDSVDDIISNLQKTSLRHDADMVFLADVYQLAHRVSQG